MIVVEDMVEDVVGDVVIELMEGYMLAPQSQQWSMHIMDIHNGRGRLLRAVHIEDVTTYDLYFGYYQYFASLFWTNTLDVCFYLLYFGLTNFLLT